MAVDKARTAAIFVRPSREIEEHVSGGRIAAGRRDALPDFDPTLEEVRAGAMM